MPDAPKPGLSDVWGQALDATPQQPAPGLSDVWGQALDATPRQSTAQKPVGDAIVATAAKLAGRDADGVRSFLKQTGQDLDPRSNAWCAAFVNGVLEANGVPGMSGNGKYVATGFLNWGQPADGEPQPGDVLVMPRGRAPGALGGHVGIATGQIADTKTGTYYLMQSGDMSGRVNYTWEPARSVVVRRPPQSQAQQ